MAGLSLLSMSSLLPDAYTNPQGNRGSYVSQSTDQVQLQPGPVDVYARTRVEPWSLTVAGLWACVWLCG